MQLLAPDILEDVRELSPLLTGTGLVVGLFLWLMGARSHRFWLVLVMTLTAGILGLLFGPRYGMQPLVAGLLLAVAVGALALALVRILLFAAAGLTGLWLAWHLAPGWDQPLVCFLAAGLAGVLLYKFWITVLASLTGTLLIGYSGLGLVAHLKKVDVVGWAERNGPLLNWGCAAVTALGLLVQFLLERRRSRKPTKEGQPEEPPKKSPPGPTWWGRVRKAGLRWLAPAVLALCCRLPPAVAQAPAPPSTRPPGAEKTERDPPAPQYAVAFMITILVLLVVCKPSRKG